MSLFYNPYSQTSILPPQADIQNQILMYLLMKQLYGPQTQTQTSTAPQPLPPARTMPPATQSMYNPQMLMQFIRMMAPAQYGG
ncbi:MAG: hypothetical protein JRI41_06785 [Deltaproteobacteria bacterium]|nr:hypothetical protein [Deltaproteobacteria bacterium]